ncbi:MAG: LuxR C-terminal-related transcriptional regulator [Anaerolineae bacterium]|nr:LuxR C-terminal-related transcriptional regulator [Anaerolineae bacterium]
MPPLILTTRLFIPTPLPLAVSRPRLITRLNDGLQTRLTLLSAPAGSGKTSLLAEWLGSQPPDPVAWLALDEGDSDLTRFLTYLAAAIQKAAGEDCLSVWTPLLNLPQPPPLETLMTGLINAIGALPNRLILVLDDYHRVDSPVFDKSLSFLLEHQPANLHLVISTREDPHLPLARLRARGLLTELRAADLRFSPPEAADFFSRKMRLNLAPDQISLLQSRTEGWAAGLQLAALSIQGLDDPGTFIRSFSGSHRYVLDYLLEEVLNRQTPEVLQFLYHTAILERFNAALCEAVLPENSNPARETLLYLEQANLFLVPLDEERGWFRYHHLFADLLRQSFTHHLTSTGTDVMATLAGLHIRASQWFEENGLELEAFSQATAAADIKRCIRLINGKGLPLHFRGGLLPVLNWLKTLRVETLNAHPALWVTYASVLSISGLTVETEEKLQSAELALSGAEMDEFNRNLIGHIAAIRALLAAVSYNADEVISQSQRALQYLAPGNLAVRTATVWKMGWAYHIRDEREAALAAYEEAFSISEKTGNTLIQVSAATGLGNVLELNLQFPRARQIYQMIIQKVGEQPMPIACEAHLGLARIAYANNDLQKALEYSQRSRKIAERIDFSDRLIAADVLQARIKLAEEEQNAAITILDQAAANARQQKFTTQSLEIITMQVLVHLRRGEVNLAGQLAFENDLPLCRARVHLAQGYINEALLVLTAYKNEALARAWKDRHFKSLLLLALAGRLSGDSQTAFSCLEETLRIAEPVGLIRAFVDEGPEMAALLSEASAAGILPDFCTLLLAAFPAAALAGERVTSPGAGQPDGLTSRELEVLQLIANGLSNHEISAQLYLALSTVKGYNQQIFDKLQVQRRTEAVARARELGLIK